MVLQWLFFVKRSTSQQRVSFQWEREKFALLMWSSATGCCVSRCPGNIPGSLFFLDSSLDGFIGYLMNLFATLFTRWGRWCTIFATTKFRSRSTWQWWIYRYPSDNINFRACTRLTIGIFTLLHLLATMKSRIIVEMISFVCRREIKGCSTSFWWSMSRSYFQSFTLQLLVKHARNTGVSSTVLRVFSSAWRKSMRW